METFHEEKTKGIIIRARVRWHEYGEKSTKYFLNLEKRNPVKKHVRKLFISGVIKTDPFCILKEQERFYRDLCKSKKYDPEITQKISACLNDLNIPKLSEKTAKAMRRVYFIRGMPWNDGNPMEFYKTVWVVLRDSFIKCVNECFEKGEMSNS